MKNFMLLVAIAFGLVHCGPDSSASDDPEKAYADGQVVYTIKNNTEKDLEEVILKVMPQQVKSGEGGVDMGNFTEVQLKAGECAILSQGDFDNLFSIEVGGLIYGTNPLCSKDKEADEVLACAAGNYNIVEEGMVFDDYSLVPAAEKDANCSSTLASLVAQASIADADDDSEDDSAEGSEEAS